MSLAALRACPAARFLLILPMPTPNGRLHLGHIAGPYLKLDVLARHLRVLGHRVSVLSGVDSYESYVTLRAHQEEASPRDTASRYHAAIARDLDAMGIQVNALPDAASGPFASAYASHNRSLVERLVERGAARVCQERIPWAAGTAEPVVGCWLVGRCPQCHAALAGFFCEQCGAHVQPEEVLQPRDRRGRALEWRSTESLFLERVDLARVEEEMSRACGDPFFLEIARRHLARHGPRLRLTVPGGWGVPWPAGSKREPHVLFSYGSGYGYAVAPGSCTASASSSP